MSYQVEYANQPLHNYVTILNVKRTLLPTRSNITKNIPAMMGEYYMGYKYTPKRISLECLLKAKTKEEFVENMQDLAFILDVKRPSKLVIDDSPDKYCYAVFDDTIDVEKVRHNGKFTIDFIVYDTRTYSAESDFFYDDGSHKLTIENGGTSSTYPSISVGFTNPAYFFQCTNTYTGETVLIGTPSNVDKPNYQFNPKVLRDSCETLEGWTNVGNIVDNAEVNGTLSINAGGYGIYCSNYGSSSSGWHGGALRKNLGQSLQDFKVRVKMEHNSLGDLNNTGASSTPPVSTGVKYTITANPSLRIRSGRGTNTKQVGSIPKGKVVTITDISGGWGKTTYNGATGYVSMDYVSKNSTTSTSTSGTYKITASPSLRIRSGRGTNFKQVGSIPYGKTVTVSDISKNWGKTSYGGKTGYISMQYTSKVNSSKSMLADEGVGSAEENLGRLEVYGFDRNGVKLFKLSLKDTDKYYEYTEPVIEIGSKVVLDDNKKCPSPKTITTQENEKNVQKQVNSGQFGDWNDFSGWFTLQRKTVGGVQQWIGTVEKLDSSGRVSRSLTTGTLSNGSYPKGELTNIVIFIGGYQEEIPVEIMNINEIEVDNLGTPPKPEENKPIFENGDELVIDFDTQKVTKNGLPFMKELDIGSQFFECLVGETHITCRSEDKGMDVIASIQKIWI